MQPRNTDRIWLMSGAVAAVVLLAIGWFLLIGPQRSTTSSLEEQTDTANTEITTLQHKLADLRKQDSEKETYKAELAKNRESLPEAPLTSEIVRQLQASGNSAGVAVADIAIGDATAVKDSTPKVYSMPISLSATGRASQIDRFLDQLQQVQPRALLINSASLTAPEEGNGKTLTMTLALEAFVAPPAGAPAPTTGPTTAAAK